MNPYLPKIIGLFTIVIVQAFVLFEIERYWLLLKSKETTTAHKVLSFIELPFKEFIKNPAQRKIIALFITPILFGLGTTGIIPFLNLLRGTNIKIGYPWGYVMAFCCGYFGIYLFIFNAYLQKFLSKKKVSINTASRMMLFYVAVFLATIYAEVYVFLHV